MPIFQGDLLIARASRKDDSRQAQVSSIQRTPPFPSTSAAISGAADETVIPKIADPAAYRANMAAIDQLVMTRKYLQIVAWGKWLGFAPETVMKSVELAASEDAPDDAIQKIDDRWLRLADIQNESNRHFVEELARESEVTQPRS